MIYAINSIFVSIQGEGYFTGTPAVFVRLGGCNRKCPLCDTDFSTRVSEDETYIVKRVQSSLTKAMNHGLSSPLVILTGGEPTIQDIVPLIKALQHKMFCVALETNGDNGIPLPRPDWVTCSPKGMDFHWDAEYNEYKFLYGPGAIPLDVVETWRDQHKLKAAYFFLQPLAGHEKECVKAVMASRHFWRISLQLHKILGVE